MVLPVPFTPPFRRRTLLVLHVFVKKTQTTPRSAIETALKRLEKST
jgi:phage-related protein